MVSAPGKVRLLGEELAALGLRTIEMAVSLRTYLAAEPQTDGVYRIQDGEEGDLSEFTPSQPSADEEREPPLRRAVAVLKHDGVSFDRGASFEFSSELPPHIGLGDAASRMVCWVTASLRLQGELDNYSARKIAALAWRALAAPDAPPEGVADCVLVTTGGLHCVDYGDRCALTPVPRALDGLVIADLGLDTISPTDAARTRERVRSAEAMLRGLNPAFTLRTAGQDEIFAMLNKLPADIAKAAYAIAVDCDVVDRARDLLLAEALDQDAFGEMLDTHHEMLRENLGFAATQVEKIIEVSRAAGALGCKVDLPRGRTVTVYAPSNLQEVQTAIRDAGAKPYVVSKAHGVSFEE